MLEDLQNADKGTLEMLTHVCRNISGKLLLLVGTYRDVEVDRAHPLAATLAELRRVSMFTRMPVRGLNTGEVKQMLASIGEQEVPEALAEMVQKQTEGNPLFVQEVIRYLVEAGLLVKEQGWWQAAKDTPLEMSIPEGLRDVIGKRLSRLSPECNRLLSVAAVIGREFRLDVLQKVAGLKDEQLFAALEEATRKAVVEERSKTSDAVTYRFAHAFFRQTLYEEIIAPRRIVLHHQVARALEGAHKNHLAEHAAELAEHYSHSSDPADLRKAVRYGEMAAKRATDVFAYGEAVRLLDQAMKVQEVLDPEDKARLCDLALATGEARLMAGEFRHVLDNEAPEALGLAEAIEDSRRACQAGRLACLALEAVGGTPEFLTPEGMKWFELADRYAPPDTVERAMSDWGLGISRMTSGEWASSLRLFLRGATLAHQLGDREAYLQNAAMWLFNCPSMPDYVAEGLNLAEEMEHVWEGTSVFMRWKPICYTASFMLGLGQRSRAEKLIQQFKELLLPVKLPFPSVWVMGIDACFQLWDGRLTEATETLASLNERSAQMGFQSGMAAISGYPYTRLIGYQGGAEEALKIVEQWEKATGLNPDQPTKAYYLANAGRQQEAAVILDQVVKQYTNIADRAKGYFPGEIVLLESAILTHHTGLAEILLAHLSDTPFKTTGFWYPTCIARHFGGGAALLGRHQEARKYYNEAIKVCTEMRFRPELALSRLQLAELLLEHYPQEKTEAISHLDFAVKEFREMKMQPSLERALRHKEIPKA